MSAAGNTSECRFCRIATSDQAAASFDSVIAQNSRYFAVASLGGFIPGWTLICTRTHELNLAAHYSAPEFHNFVTMIVRAVTEQYGVPAVFEHGATHHNSATACGTSHAHLHVVPLEASLHRVLGRASGMSWREVQLRSLQAAVCDAEYLFFADRYSGPSTAAHFARVDVPQSQYFRRALAHSLGKSELADYRQAPLEGLASETAARVRSALSLKLDAA